MNGPGSIYRLKPVYEIPKKLDLPDCMYKLKNPVACVTDANETEPKRESGDILTGIMDKVNSLMKEPLPELDSLEAKWDGILKQLSQLKLQLTDMRKTVSDACRLTGYSLVDNTTLNSLKILQGAVINAKPSNPPYSLVFLRHQYKTSVPLVFKTHVHSNLQSLPDHLKYFEEEPNEAEYNNKCLLMHIIWKDGLLDTELVMNPVKQIPIKGEVNLLKIFARSGLELLRYPSEDILQTTQIDITLDVCHRLVHSQSSKEKASLCRILNGKLGRNPYFGGDDINIVDVFACSVLKQMYESISKDLSPNLVKWYQRMDKMMPI